MPNPFDPSFWGSALLSAILGASNKILLDTLNQLIQNLQNILEHPVNLEGLDVVSFLYGNAIGVAPKLAYVAAFFALLLSVLHQRRAKKALTILPIAILVMLGSAVWFANAHYITDFGQSLTKMMNFFAPANSSSSLLDLPAITDLPLSLWAGVCIAFWIVMMWLLLLLYAVMSVSMVFWLPLVVSFYGHSQAVAKFVKITVSFLMVAAIYGPASAMFIINLAKALRSAPGFNTALPSYGIMLIAVIFAFVFQFVLMWLTYQGVTKTIGHFSGSTQVRGKVETENKDALDVNVLKFNDQHAKSMRGNEEVPWQPVTQMTRSESAILEQEKRVIQAGAKAVQGWALSSGVGAVGLGAIEGAEKIITSKLEDRAERKSRAKQSGK